MQLSDVSEVIMDCASRLWCLDRDISPQELEVTKSDSTGSIKMYYVLVKAADLNDDTCLVPLFGISSRTLYPYVPATTYLTPPGVTL